MDKIDAKLLEMLQKDARVPLKQIASEVYLFFSGSICEN